LALELCDTSENKVRTRGRVIDVLGQHLDGVASEMGVVRSSRILQESIESFAGFGCRDLSAGRSGG